MPLTTNAIFIFIVFVLYLYTYLLESQYLLVFLVASIFPGVDCIYLNCISTVYIGKVFIHIYLIGSIFLLFNTCIIKFIEGKFYFEGRACYIVKIMPTCIE